MLNEFRRRAESISCFAINIAINVGRDVDRNVALVMKGIPVGILVRTRLLSLFCCLSNFSHFVELSVDSILICLFSLSCALCFAQFLIFKCKCKLIKS